MRAGTIDRRVQLLEPVITQSDSGEIHSSYALMATVWAHMVNLPGNERFAFQQTIARSMYTFRIRYSNTTAQLTSLHRLAMDGKQYEITDVRETRRREEIQIDCYTASEQPLKAFNQLLFEDGGLLILEGSGVGNLALESIVSDAGPDPGPTPEAAWPGQAGNLVGHTAAPGFPGSLTASAWPPGGGLVSGTTYTYLDFDPGGLGGGDREVSTNGSSGGAAVNNVTFFGCRFACSNVMAIASLHCWRHGSNNITFSYCTFSPSAAIQPAPPAIAWPSASAGTGFFDNDSTLAPDPYRTLYKNGPFQHLHVAPPTGGQITIDHCDFWGMGNIAIGLGTGTPFANGTVTITDNWIHDHRNDAGVQWSAATAYVIGDCVSQTPTGPVYKAIANNTNSAPPSANWVNANSTNDHTDGILPGQGFANVVIQHNTIASIGNSNAIAFQRLDSLPGQTYDNISIINNYCSGYGYTLSVAGGPGDSNWTITDNIIATDLLWTFGPVYTGISYTAVFSVNNNLWRRNKLRVYDGSVGSFDAAYGPHNDKFVLPDGTFSSTDWSG